VNINVVIVTYNGMGGHPVLSYVGDFLLLNAPGSFGSAITTVDIYAHVQSSGRPIKTLKLLADRFQKRLKTLPLMWFKRKKCLFEIAYFSKFADSAEIFERELQSVSLTLFHDACREIVSVLLMIRKRLKTTDDFEIDAFESYLHRRLGQLPTRAAELKRLLEEIKEREQQRIAARNGVE
jgi:hypothetical protein